jgi:hypothetical protein
MATEMSTSALAALVPSAAAAISAKQYAVFITDSFSQ